MKSSEHHRYFELLVVYFGGTCDGPRKVKSRGFLKDLNFMKIARRGIIR